MKNVFKISVLAGALALAACGSKDSDDNSLTTPTPTPPATTPAPPATTPTPPAQPTPTPSPKVTITGKVIDEAVVNATVCVDANEDKKCGDDEPKTTSDADGNYTIPTDVATAKGKSTFAQGNADTFIKGKEDTKGTLEDLGLAGLPLSEEELADGSTESIANPFTTVAAAKIKKENLTKEEAIKKVADSLGVAPEAVSGDYTASDSDDAKKLVKLAPVVTKAIAAINKKTEETTPASEDVKADVKEEATADLIGDLVAKAGTVDEVADLTDEKLEEVANEEVEEAKPNVTGATSTASAS